MQDALLENLNIRQPWPIFGHELTTDHVTVVIVGVIIHFLIDSAANHEKLYDLVYKS